MLTTLALLGTLALAPSQGELKFEKTRFTYGPLGQSRESDKFLPGDTVHVAGVVKGLKAKDDGMVIYKTSYEIFKKGEKKALQKADAQEYRQLNWLGGGDLPFLAHYPIPRDNQAPGSYTMKVVFSDATGKATGTLTKDFTVEKTKLGFINTYLVGPPVAVVGDPRGLRYALVGFDLDKGKQTDVTVSIRVLDDKGKPTLAKPLSSDIKKDGTSFGGVMDFRETPIETNRPGTYTIELTARCNVSKTDVKETLTLKVVEVD